MSKYLLTLAAGMAMSVATMAQITVPSDFSVSLNESNELEGWVTYGNTSAVGGDFSADFSNHESGPWYKVLTYGGETAAFSASIFEDSSESDQWLITPEFTVSDDNVLLRYEAVAYGTRSKTKWKILLSEGGTEKDDFTTVVTSSKTMSPLQVSAAMSKGFGAEISGLKGKKVRLAFVNEGNRAGVLGFRDITVGAYSLTFDSPEEVLKTSIKSTDPRFSVGMRVSTPVETKGISATLETEEGQVLNFSNSIKLSSSTATKMTITFDDEIDFKGRGSMGYTLTIRPNMETEVAPTVVKGTMMYVDMKYDLPVLIEEFTGSWCQYCPYGAAFMEYYMDKYNVGTGNKKVIGIAVHSGDVMTVNNYESPLEALATPLGFGGLPSMMGNRSQVTHPTQFPISNFLAEKSSSRTFISRVDYDPAASNEVSVTYNTVLSYAAEDPDINASVIVIENGVKGNNSDYSQTVSSGIATLTDADIIKNFGEELLPYMQIYINMDKHSDGSYSVSYTKMVYGEVARGVFPDFYGNEVKGKFEADVPVSGNISFIMPGAVMNPENVAVVVVLSDAISGKVVAADELSFDEFNKDIEDRYEASVAAVNVGNAFVSMRNGYLNVNADSDGDITVYATDGRTLINGHLVEGENVFALDGFNGVAVVKVNTASGVVVAKVVK